MNLCPLRCVPSPKHRSNRHTIRQCSHIRQVGGLTLLVLGAVTLAACAQGSNEELVGSEDQQEQLRHQSTEQLDDRPSPRAISVNWQAVSDSEKTAVLTGRIQNATQETKLVTLQLVGIDPHGQTITRPLGTRMVPAKSSVEFKVPVTDLPTQSMDLASQVSLLATYDLSVRASDGTGRSLSHQVHSAPMHVTFDETWQQVTARSTAQQAKANSLQFRRSVPKAGRLRHFNISRSEVEERSPSLTGEAALPIIMVTDKGPSTGPTPPEAVTQD
jgi:hypothetical protein